MERVRVGEFEQTVFLLTHNFDAPPCDSKSKESRGSSSS